MNALTTRKRQLIARADHHRRLLELERVRLGQRVQQTRDFVRQNRWWLAGGAIAGGILLTQEKRGLPGWLGVVSKFLRIFESTDS